MEFIKSFIEMSARKDIELRNNIFLLFDIVRKYEDECTLIDDNSAYYNCRRHIEVLLSYFESFFSLSENLRTRAEQLYNKKARGNLAFESDPETNKICSSIFDIERDFGDFCIAKELISEINTAADTLQKEDLKVQMCLEEIYRSIYEVEESYCIFFKYVHRMQEAFQQTDGSLANSCNSEFSIFRENATATKDKSKNGGLKAWLSSHIGKEKRGTEEKIPEAVLPPPVPRCNENNQERCTDNCAFLEKPDEVDIIPLEISDVQFSAVVQKKIHGEEYLPINVIMYEDGFRNVVEERLNDAIKEVRSGYHSVVKNSIIKVVISSKDIVVDDCEEERIWHGKFLDFSFVVGIPENNTKKQIMFCASVYVNDLIATRLKFFVDVNSTEEQKLEVERLDVITAFVSYASKDRDRVASIIQGMKKARPDMDVFFDVETLRSGQKWEEELKNEIDNRSTFFLCWSKAASESKWVDFEWRYALEKKGDECIEPIPIEPPETCPPPIELQQKHFNDKMVYLIKALEYMNK